MNIKSYEPVIDFLASFLGSRAEIILYDVIKKNIAYVKNSFSKKHMIGQEIREAELKMIEDKIYLKKDFVSNYRALSEDKQKLRSGTYFIKRNQDLVGMITINYKVGDIINLRNMIDEIINGDITQSIAIRPNKDRFFETFNGSFEEMMSAVINDIVNHFNVPPDRLSLEEKMQVIRELDSKGTFLIKGSIGETAKILNTSEATIYRYLNQL